MVIFFRIPVICLYGNVITRFLSIVCAHIDHCAATSCAYDRISLAIIAFYIDATMFRAIFSLLLVRARYPIVRAKGRLGQDGGRIGFGLARGHPPDSPALNPATTEPLACADLAHLLVLIPAPDLIGRRFGRVLFGQGGGFRVGLGRGFDPLVPGCRVLGVEGHKAIGGQVGLGGLAALAPAFGLGPDRPVNVPGQVFPANRPCVLSVRLFPVAGKKNAQTHTTCLITGLGRPGSGAAQGAFSMPGGACASGVAAAAPA